MCPILNSQPLYKAPEKELESNGYNIRADWTIDNFIFDLGDILSPIYSCISLNVQMTLKKLRDSEIEIVLALNCKGTSILYSNFRCTLQINHNDSKMSEKIETTGLLKSDEIKTTFRPTTKLTDIQEGTFLNNGKLNITCFIRFEDGLEGKVPPQQEEIPHYEWKFPLELCDFLMIEEPFEMGKAKFTFFLIRNEEKDFYDFSAYIFDITDNIDLKVEVTIHNKDPLKNVEYHGIIHLKKNQTTSEDPIQMDPIQLGFITQDEFNNEKNGWIKNDHFNITIQFQSYAKTTSNCTKCNEDCITKLQNLIPYDTRRLRVGRPITVSKNPNEKRYHIVHFFPEILSHLNENIVTHEYLTGGIITRAEIDVSAKNLTIKVTDSMPTNSGSVFKGSVTFCNSVRAACSFKKDLYELISPSKDYVNVCLPFSVEDLYRAGCGWLFDGALKIELEISNDKEFEDQIITSPFKISATLNTFYSALFEIPVSLLDRGTVQNQSEDKNNVKNENYDENPIIFPKCYAGQMIFIPSIDVSEGTNGMNELSISLNVLRPNNFTASFFVSFQNMESSRCLSQTLVDVENPVIILDTMKIGNLEQDGFVFEGGVCKLTINVYYCKKEDDSPSNIYNEYEQLNFNQYKNSYKESSMIPDDTSLLTCEKSNTNEDSSTKYGESSKKETGFVGLNNQGATCYMNSLLQALYHLPAFRKLVYEMPISENEDSEISIPLNMQKLFCNMQYSDKSCSTVDLTKSFGWGSAETFMQHDVEEFSRVLIDNLESKMKGTGLDDAIPRLFKGKYRSYIRCKNVKCDSSHVDEFYDLSMDVKGIPSLLDSFRHYIQPEELTGENQYSTDEFGKQDAMMGTEFLEFPPVLHLHLRRFMYDAQTNGMIKINDWFEFPKEIDLTEFLAENAPDRKKLNIFDLYGVIVHDGGVYGGHYYAFLRTSTDTQWFKFNDSRVTKDTYENAVLNNYGVKKKIYQNNQKENNVEENKNKENENKENKNKENENKEKENKEKENKEKENKENENKENENKENENKENENKENENKENENKEKENKENENKENESKENENESENKVSHENSIEKETGYNGENDFSEDEDDGEDDEDEMDTVTESDRIDSELIISSNKSCATAQSGMDICTGESDFYGKRFNRKYNGDKNKRKKYNTGKNKGNGNLRNRNIRRAIFQNKMPRNNNNFICPSNHSIDNDNDFYGYTESHTGYILIYVRREDADSLFEPITKEELPKILREKMENNINKEKERNDRNQKERNNVIIDFIHESILKTNSANQILGFNSDLPFSQKTLDISTTTAELYLLISTEIGVDQSKIRLWLYDKSYLPSRIINNSESENIKKLIQYGCSLNRQFKVMIQEMKEENEMLNIDPKKMVYIKFFFPEHSIAPLQYLFSIAVDPKAKIDTLFPLVNEKLGFPAETKLEVYREPRDTSTFLLKNETTFMTNTIGNGSILIFQVASGEKMPEVASNSFEFEKPVEDMNENKENSLHLIKESDLVNDENGSWLTIQRYCSKFITFEICDYRNHLMPLFLLQLSATLSIDETKKFIMKAANIDYDNKSDYVLLFRPKGKEISKIEGKTFDKLKCHFNDEPSNGKYHQIYFYKFADVKPLSPNFSVETYKTQFSFDGRSIDFEKQVFAVNEMKCCDIFQILKDTTDIPFGEGPFRYLLVEKSRISRIIGANSVFSSRPYNSILRIEVIPESQRNILSDSSSFIFVNYAYKDGYDFVPFGQPFVLDIIEGEKFEQTKERLKKYMDLPESDNLETYSFFLKVSETEMTVNYNELLKENILSEIEMKGYSRITIVPVRAEKPVHTSSTKTTSNPNREVRIYH